jgi:GNAT superfamily N-acetyltransferase
VDPSVAEKERGTQPLRKDFGLVQRSIKCAYLRSNAEDERCAEKMISDDPLLDPAWNALETAHARFAVGGARARRYPAEVVPFAAVADDGEESLAELAELLAPDEHVYLFGPQPVATNGIDVGPPLHCHQMLGPSRPPIDPGGDGIQILRMTSEDAGAMVALTTLAFPGFFRERTQEMGTYCGIRVDGELVAMAGERLCLPGLREISAVVTRPGHTGKGYAHKLMTYLLREHATAGFRSFLHVNVRNSRAIALYERMGFKAASSIALWPVSRAS